MSDSHASYPPGAIPPRLRIALDAIRHGRAVVIAAAVWAAGIVALGFASSLAVGLVCLAVAGAADMVSGVFRGNGGYQWWYRCTGGAAHGAQLRGEIAAMFLQQAVGVGINGRHVGCAGKDDATSPRSGEGDH